MGAREDVTRYWDEVLGAWTAGERDVPADLAPWFRSYRGSGRGQVVLEAFPEPYLGPLSGTAPAMALLGLNPGRPEPQFQGPTGIFTSEIGRSSYGRWAASAPYSSPEWERRMGRNRYHQSRLRFAQALLERPDVRAEQLLTVELYPWHSTAVTAAMRPPPDILERFVWSPLRELQLEHVFAFGKPWIRAAEGLGLGAGEVLDVVWSSSARHARTYGLPSGQTLVVIHQSGYSGPPSAQETALLRSALFGR